MKPETYKEFLKIARDFKDKYGIVVTMNVFKETMVHTLHKIGRIRKQIEAYVDTNEYIPLLFEDCLHEHYMFDLCRLKSKGGCQ